MDRFMIVQYCAITVNGELQVLGTVLIADDNTLVRESFSHVLRRRGYTVVEAADGEVAFGLIEKKNVDLAIVDIMMPGMGGLELRQAIDVLDQPIPTILVTGQPELVAGLVQDDPDFQTGQISLLQKPVHPVKLLAEVEKRLPLS